MLNSAFNAQGLRIIVVVVHGRNENICSNSEGIITWWNLVYHKNWWFLWVSPYFNVYIYIYIESQGFNIVFSLFYG
jgi:hypothetical protein